MKAKLTVKRGKIMIKLGNGSEIELTDKKAKIKNSEEELKFSKNKIKNSHSIKRKTK